MKATFFHQHFAQFFHLMMRIDQSTVRFIRPDAGLSNFFHYQWHRCIINAGHFDRHYKSYCYCGIYLVSVYHTYFHCCILQQFQVVSTNC
jgi:hypothetical protein